MIIKVINDYSKYIHRSITYTYTTNMINKKMLSIILYYILHLSKKKKPMLSVSSTQYNEQ